MRAFALCLVLVGCGGGGNEVDDLSKATPDLSSAGHLGDACTSDAQCLAGHCITVAEWPNGPYHLCGQRCTSEGDGGTCLEGACAAFSYGSWCVESCTGTCSDKSFCCFQSQCLPAVECQI